MSPAHHFSIQALFGIVILLAITGLDFSHCRKIQGGNTGVNRKQVRPCPRGRICFPRTRRCYITGRKGPCGELMNFVRSAADAFVGECICESPGNTSSSSCLPERPLIFVKQFSRCYPLYLQGPCRTGEWLVPSAGNRGVCKKIPCPEAYYAQFSSTPEEQAQKEEAYVSAFGDKCLTAVCPRVQKFEVVSPPPKIMFHLQSTAVSSCTEGSAPDGSGGCEPEALI